MGRALSTAFLAIATAMMAYHFTLYLWRQSMNRVDSPTKFIGMEVPRGCGCSSGLFIMFIIVVIVAMIFGGP